MPQEMNLSEIRASHIYLLGILTCECDIYRYRRPSFHVYSSYYLCVGHQNAYISQAGEGFRTSQDTLIDILNALKCFPTSRGLHRLAADHGNDGLSTII